MSHRANNVHPVEARSFAGRCLGVANSASTSGPQRACSFVVEVDSDARQLRESLRRLSQVWRLFEPSTAQRVRTLLTQAVSRATDPRRGASGAIRVRLHTLASTVRIEITGPGLHSRYEGSATHEPPFPIWIFEDLAERWGSGPGEETLWFEIDGVPGEAPERTCAGAH
jgi:hypothetical protein